MASLQPYADGFLLPLPLDKVEAYRLIASQAGAVWMEHGALAYHESVADDLNAPDMVSFAQAAGAQPDETVVLAWILFRSREHRDAVNAAVMADERLKEMMAGIASPFDYRRMAYGGFRTLVSL